VEKARQYSALTTEKLAFGAVWFAGPLILFVGILLALTLGNRGIAIGLIGQAISRVTTAVWALVRPEAQITNSPIWWRIVAAFLWSLFALAIARRGF
jgi:hypothetical protein